MSDIVGIELSQKPRRLHRFRKCVVKHRTSLKSSMMGWFSTDKVTDISESSSPNLVGFPPAPSFRNAFLYILCFTFYASAAQVIGRRRHDVFHLSVRVCVRTCTDEDNFSTGLPSTSSLPYVVTLLCCMCSKYFELLLPTNCTVGPTATLSELNKNTFHITFSVHLICEF